MEPPESNSKTKNGSKTNFGTKYLCVVLFMWPLLISIMFGSNLGGYNIIVGQKMRLMKDFDNLC
jgi:hypothetical protein